MITVNPRNVEPEDTVRIRRSSLITVVYVLLAFSAGIGLGYLMWGGQSTQQAAANNETPILDAAAVQRFDVPAEGPAIGPADAAVTIIEFSDFQCPYCKKWFMETWPQIQQAYQGKVRLVYRDFPLYGAHPDAESAAEAANCAGAQNAYWAYHDRLFTGQSLGSDVYLTYAAALKLDQAKFTDCMNNHVYQKDIQADYQYGATLGINGTPTFFINGIPLVGAQPFAAFKQVIDKELANKN